MEPIAAPIRVFSEALRILSSKRIMQMATRAPTPADIHGSPPTGFSTYPAAMRKAVKINRIRTTSACITRESYHAGPTPSPKTSGKPAGDYVGALTFNKKGRTPGPPFFLLQYQGFSAF